MSVPPPRPPRFGLRFRLALLVIAALVPPAAFQLNELRLEREQRISAAVERVQESARIVAERYRDAIDDARSTLDLLSRVPEVTSGTAEACGGFLEKTRQGRPWAAAFFLVDQGGRIHCATVPKAVGLDVSRRTWYLQTLAAAGFTVSDFYVTLASKRPTVAAARPLEIPIPAGGAPVLMANLDLGWFDTVAAALGRKYGAAVLLVDGAGRALSRYPASPVTTGQDLSGLAPVALALKADEGSFEGAGPDGKPRIFGTLRLPGTDARLIVSLDREAVLAPIDAVVLRTVLLLVGIVAVLGGVIWLAGQRIFVEPLMEAGQALAKSEAFLRGVVDVSGDCIKVIDLAGNLEFISRNGLALMEVENPETILGKPFVGLWPEASQVEILAKLDDARDGQPVQFDAEILSAKGTPMHVDVLITALKDAAGRTGRLVAIARDITHVKQAERSAREAEALFRDVFDNATDSLTIYEVGEDGDFRILTWNPYASEVMRRPAAQARGARLEDVLPPEPAARIRADLEAAVARGEVVRREDEEIRPDGTRRTWEVIHVPLRDPASDRVVRVFGSGRDITHQRAIEAAVRESEARYRLLADNATDIIALIGLDGRPTYVSPACLPITGYAPEELVGRATLGDVHPDDVADVRASFRGLLEAGPGARLRLDYRVRHKDGHWVWLSINPTVLFDPETGRPAGFLDVVRDATARKAIEADLQGAKAIAELARSQAEQASRAKTDFLATMSHEIRTPLNAIIGFTGLIMDRGGDLPPEIRRHTELVQSSGAALLTIVDDILDFSKIEAGAIVLEAQAFPLAALVDNCVSIVRGSVRDPAIEVKASLDAKLPRGIVGDQARLRQVLLNLLTNAVKFTRAGYVAVSVRHEGSGASGERIRFAISDTGIGIPKAAQGRLFQRFSQADGSIRRDFGGTGLGLAICKSLVEMMGGEIGVFSEEGQGSTFWFTVTLPRGRLDAGPTPVVAPGGIGARRRGHLLLVEDVAINQELARLVLEAAGHSVDVVGDGAAAIRAVAETAYDLVLMDVQMPGMDGVSATQAIRASPRPGRRLPIVAMTANVLPDQIRRFREAGMDDHVGKPFNRAELYATIDRWLPDPDAGAVADPARFDVSRSSGWNPSAA